MTGVILASMAGLVLVGMALGLAFAKRQLPNEIWVCSAKTRIHAFAEHVNGGVCPRCIAERQPPGHLITMSVQR